jgi:DNA-binding beta-propeller fold protein YncE
MIHELVIGLQYQKFDRSGNFIAKWGTSGNGDGQLNMPSGLAVDSSENILVVDEGNDRVQKFDNNGTFMTKWGTTGTGDGEFDEPTGIAINSSGNVYVVGRDNSRIQIFAPQ